MAVSSAAIKWHTHARGAQWRPFGTDSLSRIVISTSSPVRGGGRRDFSACPLPTLSLSLSKKHEGMPSTALARWGEERQGEKRDWKEGRRRRRRRKKSEIHVVKNRADDDQRRQGRRDLTVWHPWSHTKDSQRWEYLTREEGKKKKKKKKKTGNSAYLPSFIIVRRRRRLSDDMPWIRLAESLVI